VYFSLVLVRPVMLHDRCATSLGSSVQHLKPPRSGAAAAASHDDRATVAGGVDKFEKCSCCVATFSATRDPVNPKDFIAVDQKNPDRDLWCGTIWSVIYFYDYTWKDRVVAHEYDSAC
jgi:hypothetical protein